MRRSKVEGFMHKSITKVTILRSKCEWFSLRLVSLKQLQTSDAVVPRFGNNNPNSPIFY